MRMLTPNRETVAERGLFPNLMRLVIFLLCASVYSLAADSGPQVALNTSKAGPRAVETLTEHAILRDYKYAWANLTRALETTSIGPLNGLFEGNASTALNQLVRDQRKSGLSTSYLNQNHKVEAVFYSPEGDLIELHDTADYDL